MPGVPEPEGQPNPRQAEMSSTPGPFAIANLASKRFEASFHTKNKFWAAFFGFQIIDVSVFSFIFMLLRKDSSTPPCSASGAWGQSKQLKHIISWTNLLHLQPCRFPWFPWQNICKELRFLRWKSHIQGLPPWSCNMGTSEKSGNLQRRPIFSTSPLNDFHMPFTQTLCVPFTPCQITIFPTNPFNQLELWRGESPRQPVYLILFLLRTHFFHPVFPATGIHVELQLLLSHDILWHTWSSYKPHRNTQP